MRRAVIAACLLLAATPVVAQSQDAALRRQALDHAYNLDFDGGRALVRELLSRTPPPAVQRDELRTALSREGRRRPHCR
jgi:hypothetical protein